MQAPQLIDLLSRLGFSRDGDAFLCPAEHQATVYVGLGQEPLIIDRVARIELVGENLLLFGHRRERYATAVGALLAVRLASDQK
ncbi:MAG: hypothetical protein R3B48_03100 [Kofleriaceae bacterium]